MWLGIQTVILLDQKQIESQREATFLCLRELQSVTQQNFNWSSHYPLVRKSILLNMKQKKRQSSWAEIFKKSTPVTLYANNEGSISPSNNLELYCWTKHIDIWFHWIDEGLSINQLNIVYITMAKIADDNLNKSFAAHGLLKFCCMIDIGTGL